MSRSDSHLAAVLSAKGARFAIGPRTTATPGPTELLIEVKSIGLNPIDFKQRDIAFPPLAGYPSVLGHDVGGIVLAAGSAVSADAPKVGNRVAALAPTYWMKGVPDYGAFQRKVLVPASNAAVIPDSLSFNEAAMLPMSVGTAFSGLNCVGLRDTVVSPADKQAILVWGGASSLGSGALQIVKLKGFSPYVVASEKNHAYLKTLGATKCFDYKTPSVVKDIVAAIEADGVTLRAVFNAAPGANQQCMDVLSKVKSSAPKQLATAIHMNDEDQAVAAKVEELMAKFILAPSDEQEQREHFRVVFNVWLTEKLARGEYKASPKLEIFGKGLDSLDKGLDVLKAGVSGTKLVVEDI